MSLFSEDEDTNLDDVSGFAAGQIPFVQYLRPNGRKRVVHIERPQPIVAKAVLLHAEGFCLEVELFLENMVSLTISDPELDLDVAIIICRNNEEVPASVDRLIGNFDLEKAKSARALQHDK